jgi:hypothetical protein
MKNDRHGCVAGGGEGEVRCLLDAFARFLQADSK